MVKLCIFDLDGTVLDTVSTIGYYGNYALKKNGIEEIPIEEYKLLAGTGIKNLVKNMLLFRNCYSEELYNKVFYDYDTAYNADVTKNTTIFSGLKETLDKIKETGAKLAIVSNKPDYAAKNVTYKIYGENYFDFVSGQSEDFPLKPDPSLVLKVVSDFGAKAEECIYVGDTSTDMQTGKNAELYTVGVLWGFRGEEELLANGADILIKRPEELYDIVTK